MISLFEIYIVILGIFCMFYMTFQVGKVKGFNECLKRIRDEE